MKEHTLDILTAALVKYGTRVFWAAVIVFVGLRIIRIAAGQPVRSWTAPGWRSR